MHFQPRAVGSAAAVAGRERFSPQSGRRRTMDVRPRASGGHAGPITLRANARQRPIGTDGPKGGPDWAAIFSSGLLVVLFVLSAGCRQVEQRQGKSPLQPAQMSPDSIALDISFVRFPFGQAEANGRLWEEIDEQGVASDVRQRLIPNGFRTGLVSDPMPEGLAKLLEPKDKPASTAVPRGAAADLEKEPRMVTRRLQLRAEHRAEIACSEIYERLSVLIRDRLGVTGGDLYQAQGMIVVTAHLEPDRHCVWTWCPRCNPARASPTSCPAREVSAWKQTSPAGRSTNWPFTSRSCRGKASYSAAWRIARAASAIISLRKRPKASWNRKLLVIRLAQTQRDDLFDPRAPQPLNVLAGEGK